MKLVVQNGNGIELFSAQSPIIPNIGQELIALDGTRYIVESVSIPTIFNNSEVYVQVRPHSSKRLLLG